MGGNASKKEAPVTPAEEPDTSDRLKERKYSWTERILGRGELSTVYYALLRNTGRQVAIKRIAADQLTPKTVARLTTEAKILHEVSQKIGVSEKFAGIIEGFIDHQGGMCIVMDHIDGYDLFDLLRRNPRGLSEKKAKKMIMQIFEAVLILHASDIAHLDLKLENIMYDTVNKTIKLIDFGFATKTHKVDLETGHKENIYLDNFCGSLYYLSPEIVKKQKFLGKPADIWSLGVVCYALLTGKFPFEGQRPPKVYEKILQCNVVMPDHLSEGAKNILTTMFQPIAADRYTILDLLQHPWLYN